MDRRWLGRNLTSAAESGNITMVEVLATMPSVREVVKELGIHIVSEREDGEATAFCPLHDNTNTPSFSINMEKGLWNCYAGCGGGTLARLVSRMRGIPAQEVHVKLDLKARWAAKKDARRIEEKDIDVYPLATGDPFLIRRGVTEESIIEWQLRDTGLGILFPIRDAEGVLAGSAVRLKVFREGHDVAKYTYNSGFRRNEVVFGIEKTKRSPKRYVILVEGLIDAVIMHQLGFESTVAILGTSMGLGQLGMLRKTGFESAVLMFDNDPAGRVATAKVATSLLGLFNVFVPNYESYPVSDPGEFTRKSQVTKFLRSYRSYLRSKLGGA